jgi:SAM-dependent methyltransferase
MCADLGPRSGPPPRVRIIGRTISGTVARFPFLWRFLRTPTRRFFDRAAPEWDQRLQPDSQLRLASLDAAIAHLESTPQRVLDLGTGTGKAAFWLAKRFPEAEIVGADLSPAMIEGARGNLSPELAGRLCFEVADAADLSELGTFDLIVQVNVPVFFTAIARALRPGGHVAIVSTLGPATPFHTPAGTLQRGFERRGLVDPASGAEGSGTWFLARRPD